MKMGDELEWKPASCWNDLEAAIKQAKVMIYIVGEPASFKFHVVAKNIRQQQAYETSLG